MIVIEKHKTKRKAYIVEKSDDPSKKDRVISCHPTTRDAEYVKAMKFPDQD